RFPHGAVSLRLRVAVTTTLVTLLVVGLAGIALIALVAREERDRLDEDLTPSARLAATRTIAEIRNGRVAVDSEEPAQNLRAPLTVVARARIEDRVVVEFGEYP